MFYTLFLVPNLVDPSRATGLASQHYGAEVVLLTCVMPTSLASVGECGSVAVDGEVKGRQTYVASQRLAKNKQLNRTDRVFESRMCDKRK